MKRLLLKTGGFFLNFWEHPINACILSLLVYGGYAALKYSLIEPSTFPYYNYLADAFLHGQLSLRILPEQTYDLVYFHDQYFLYWPPFPAIVLLPFILIFGVDFSDITFTVIVAAINIALVPVLLRTLDLKDIVKTTSLQRGMLTIFIAFGTVHIILATNGRIWFTAQILGLCFILLAYICSIKFHGFKGFFFTGLMLSFALLTRNNLIFNGIWPAYYLLYTSRSAGVKKITLYSLIGIFPILLAIIGYMIYNASRFGNPLDLGLDYHLMYPGFTSDYGKFGAFNLHYLPINFFYQYIHYPFPFHEDSYMGGSLFLMSPLFFVAIPALVKLKPRLSAISLFHSIFFTNIPILLLMGTGWIQIGPRYTLDFFVPLLILTAFGIRVLKDWFSFLLMLLSVIQYGYGLFLPL